MLRREAQGHVPSCPEQHCAPLLTGPGDLSLTCAAQRRPLCGDLGTWLSPAARRGVSCWPRFCSSRLYVTGLPQS